MVQCSAVQCNVLGAVRRVALDGRINNAWGAAQRSEAGARCLLRISTAVDYGVELRLCGQCALLYGNGIELRYESATMGHCKPVWNGRQRVETHGQLQVLQ